MKPITLFAVLGLAGALNAQISPPTYGKTDVQILSMGLNKWVDFASSKDGSNLGMIQASQAYRSAAARRNDRQFARMPLGSARDMRRLRGLLRDYSDQCSTVGSYISGGGSMWSVIDAGANAEVEDVLYCVAVGKGKLAPATKISKVDNELMRAGLEVTRHRRADAEGRHLQEEAQAAVGKAKQDLQSITGIASHLKRAKSDAVLDFCYRRIHVGAEGEFAVPKRQTTLWLFLYFVVETPIGPNQI